MSRERCLRLLCREIHVWMWPRNVAAVVIFILCWFGTFLSFASPTHAYIALFTNAERQSLLALIEGSTWSLLFGFFSGALIAALYNLFAPLGRR